MAKKGAKKNKDQLFEKEEKILEKAKSARDRFQIQPSSSSLFSDFSELLHDYERMYKQQRFLVKMSDKRQRRLNLLNEQLDVRSRFIKKIFGQYLSSDIVETILESPEGDSIGGEKRIITILMSDIRGFTARTEGLPAETIVGAINNYLEVMTDIILKHRGTIDEFQGDGILALFGAPVIRDDDAQRAVACAIEMQLAMEEVSWRNQELGYPELEMGIGINTGEIVVGNIGSSRRKKYGVVGTNMNLTSRIESYTVGGQILISENTKNACGPILEIVGQIEVIPKGIKKPVTIYDISGIYGDYHLILPKKSSHLVKLEKPLDIKFSMVSGKQADAKQYPGKFVRMSDREADILILADIKIHKMEDLKISILDEPGNELVTNLYAKISQIISQSHRVFRVNFTGLTPEVKSFLEKSSLQ
jgi:adenylate cyclase